MEDVAAGQPEFAVQVERCLRLDAGPALGVGGEAVGERLGQVGVELGEGGPEQAVPDGVPGAARTRRARTLRAAARAAVLRRVALEEPGRGVQAEEGEGVVAALRELRPEDRRVRERVAVDLAGRRPGELPAAACRWASASWP